MKLKTLWLVVFAVVLCAAPAGTFACSTPPTLTITYSWPGWTGGTDDVNVIPGNVPGGPVSTAISNWNNGLLAFCYPPFLQESTVGSTGTINMSYASIPPPSNCPSRLYLLHKGDNGFTRRHYYQRSDIVSKRYSQFRCHKHVCYNGGRRP